MGIGRGVFWEWTTNVFQALAYGGALTGLLIMFFSGSCAVTWWGMLPGPEHRRSHPYKKRGKHRKQSAWVTHTGLWHQAALGRQTLAFHQYVPGTVFCIKILGSPVLYALGSKWLHHLHEEEWEARINYPQFASCTSVSLSFDRYRLSVCSVTLLSLNCKNKLSSKQCHLSWVIKPAEGMLWVPFCL